MNAAAVVLDEREAAIAVALNVDLPQVPAKPVARAGVFGQAIVAAVDALLAAGYRRPSVETRTVEWGVQDPASPGNVIATDNEAEARSLAEPRNGTPAWTVVAHEVTPWHEVTA